MRLRIRGPADVLALVAIRLGFHPRNSLAIVAFEGAGNSLGFALRVDLPPPGDENQVCAAVVDALRTNHAREALLVVYADDAPATRDQAVRLLRRIEHAGITFREALLADPARWYSLTCAQACCPAAGTPYDLSSNPVLAEAVVQGVPVLPGRDDLAQQVAPGPCDEQTVAAFRDARDAAERVPLRTGCEQVVEFVRGYVADPRILSLDEIAWLSVWCRHVPVRDCAWLLISRPDAGVHLGLWQQVLSRVIPPYEPAVGSLAAFAAWLDGDGALSLCALDRALAADPDYSWALLLQDALTHAMPPSAWDDFERPSLADVMPDAEPAEPSRRVG